MLSQQSPKVEEEEDEFTFEYLSPVEGEKSQRKSSGRSNCWNCGDSSHNLRDCPKPRDIKSINKNRRLFQAAGNENKRYHEIVPDKYSHLKPGDISKALRDALGLGERQLPKHIYRMRSLGYPPGWILEAEIKDNKLYMFGDNGEIVLGEDDDEGELRKKIRYDLEKIVEYHGFNIKPDSKYLKEEDRYDAPEFNPLSSKETLVEHLGNAEEQFEFTYGDLQSSSTKTVQKPSEVEAKKASEVETNEPMEVETNNDINIPGGPVAETGPLADTTMSAPEETIAPTVSSSAPEPDDELNLPSTSKGFQNLPSTSKGFQSLPSTSKGSETTSVLESSSCEPDLIQGTTIYSEETSEFSTVPPLDNFRSGVDELLYFQNLPASTGSFQAIRSILSKMKESREASS